MTSQGLYVIFFIIIGTLIKTTDAFAGRRKHVAHIFGKRADYDIANTRTHGQTFDFGAKAQGLHDLDYYTSQERGQKNQVFPNDEKVNRNFDNRDDGEYNVNDVAGLFDLPNNDNDHDFPEESIRQKFFDMYIFDRLPRYKK